MAVKKYLSGKVLAGFALSVACCGLTAQNFTNEIRLAKALNEIGLTDYADEYIENLIRKNPGNDLLEAQRIDNYLNQNKMEEAIAMAKKFPQGSDAYFETLSSIGIFYISRSKFEEGIAQLAPVKEHAARSGKIKEFQRPLMALMTAYQKSGRAVEASQVLELVSMAKDGDGTANNRSVLLTKAKFGLESVEEMKKRQEVRTKMLGEKIESKRRLVTLPPAEKEKLYKEMEARLGKALQDLAAASPSVVADLQKLLAQKKAEDTKYYAELKKDVDAVQANQNRLKVYTEIGRLAGISEQEMAEIAEMARIHSDPQLQTTVNQLMAGRAAAENNFYANCYNPNPAFNNSANTLTRQKWYKKFGKALGISESEIMEYAGYEKVKRFQPKRRNLLLKGYTNLSIEEKNELNKTDPMDWQDVIYKAYEALNEVMWGGQDVPTAMAVALDMRADYYLGNYDSALRGIRKNKRLFQLCDDAYAKDGVIEESPGADAKMWEACLAAAYAKELEGKNKKDEALKYYKQAFVAFGNFLKKYSKHKNAGKCYGDFVKSAENVTRLQPSMAVRLQQEMAKVKKPENQDENAAVEELVQPIPEDAFKNGYNLAMNVAKKKNATEQDWAAVKKYFTVVSKELEPVMAEKYLSSGLPKVMRYLLIANGYLGNTFKVQTLSNLGKFKFRDNDLVQNGVIIAGNALWQEAERLEKAGKTAEAKALKDETTQVYADFLTIAKSHDFAPLIAVRLARESFIKANEEGIKLNKETNPDVRAVITRNWMSGFDSAINRYKFVLKNFSHRPEFIDEAYERSIEAYTLTKRYMDAVELGKDYCANGSEVASKILNAKTDIAANLYQEGNALEKQATGKRLDAAAVVIPQPVKPEAPSAAASAPAAKTAAAPEASAEPAVAEDPQAVYEKALAQYESDLKQVKIQTEKKETLNKEADELSARAKECYREAVTHLNELLDKWLVKGGPYEKEIQTSAADQNRLRAASLLPCLYDGAGDMENAAKHYLAFVQKYPNEKSVPQYLLRLSVLCAEMGKNSEASQVLNLLTTKYPNTPEGKNAKFALAHNLYGRGNYTMALQTLHEIFSSADLKKNLTITNYRWIASELVKCPDPQFAKTAASYALLASEELVRMVQNPVAKDWVGELKAKEFESNPEEGTKYFTGLYEKLLIDAAVAASAMGEYNKAIRYFNDLEKLNKNTPYIYALYFGRAKAYLSLTPKRYEDAKIDLSKLGRRANLANQTAIYNKAQAMIGEIWEEQGNLQKAYALYNIIAAIPFSETTVLKVDPDHPEDDTPLYLEKAVYKAAELAGKIGRTADMKLMIEKYQKYYPDGKYKIEVKNLEQ